MNPHLVGLASSAPLALLIPGFLGPLLEFRASKLLRAELAKEEAARQAFSRCEHSVGFRCQRIADGDRLSGPPGPDLSPLKGLIPSHPLTTAPEKRWGATPWERGAHILCYQGDPESPASWGTGPSGRERPVLCFTQTSVHSDTMCPSSRQRRRGDIQPSPPASDRLQTIQICNKHWENDRFPTSEPQTLEINGLSTSHQTTPEDQVALLQPG